MFYYHMTYKHTYARQLKECFFVSLLNVKNDSNPKVLTRVRFYIVTLDIVLGYRERAAGFRHH